MHCVCVHRWKDCVNGLWHHPHPFPLVLPHPHAHLPLPLPPNLTLPTNLISGMPHAEPSADTGAQCDSRIPPRPPPPHPPSPQGPRLPSPPFRSSPTQGYMETGVGCGKGSGESLSGGMPSILQSLLFLGSVEARRAWWCVGGWHECVCVCMHAWLCLEYGFHATKAWLPYVQHGSW